MRSKFIVFLMVTGLLFFTSVTSHAAESSVDNMLGGAGIAYWQAGGEWTTLLNIQEESGVCALIHIVVYDRNGTGLMSFNMKLRPFDNVGIVVGSDGTNIQLTDYSDTAYGGSSALNDYSTGPAVVLSAPSDSDGVQRGYVTVVRTNYKCLGPDGAPSDNISGLYGAQNNVLCIRTAILNPNSAFALNAVMLQGFANMGTVISEINNFIDTIPSPNSPVTCDFNGDGDTIDSWTTLDDANGADIDFAELFLTDNLTSNGPWIICDHWPFAPFQQSIYNAVGVTSGEWYSARFNNNPSAGTQTKLIIIAPQSTHPSAALYPRRLTVKSFNDEGSSVTYGPVSFNVVASLPFGTGGIDIGSATAGEAFLYSDAPIFGFTYTESASFAGIYPLVRSRIVVSPFFQVYPLR